MSQWPLLRRVTTGRDSSPQPEQARRRVQGRHHSFSLNDTVTSVSFEAKANYLQPRRCGAATKAARLLQAFLAGELSPEPANIRGDSAGAIVCAHPSVMEERSGGQRAQTTSWLVPDHQHMLHS